MTLIPLIVAFAPLVWAKVRTIWWRSGSYRGLPIGGVAFGSAGVLVTSAVHRSAIWSSPLAYTLGANLDLLGWFWVPEGVFMAVAGVVILLTFGPTDGQRTHAPLTRFC